MMIYAGWPVPMGFLVAEEYYRIPWLTWLFNAMRCVPVKRDGRDMAAARQTLRQLSAPWVLCIFPDGGLSNAGRGRPRRGKAGIALVALRSEAPLYPVLIQGGPQTRQVLSAWLHPSRKQARITVGPPIDLSAYRGRRIDRRLIEEVMTLIVQRLCDLYDKPR
jgi:1-acyl-sn-glycerol-3-phosphate acyltransferase